MWRNRQFLLLTVKKKRRPWQNRFISEELCRIRQNKQRRGIWLELRMIKKLRPPRHSIKIILAAQALQWSIDQISASRKRLPISTTPRKEASVSMHSWGNRASNTTSRFWIKIRVTRLWPISTMALVAYRLVIMQILYNDHHFQMLISSIGRQLSMACQIYKLN